ncbi:DUF962 domain-containing protein [Paenibacillus sambharensis]|uniref:DUF962 domain-containing protein n=1 Tax=Paenibacillus sambharensis TaxID=1803190 RepID=A0A2W1LFF8_9BACL|nr:DUF962 domain-containing protein [Paenibacillus sambharensis]PZD97439.1 DUF962 domain-containing protein [Paenibacillus sambharensis]
MDFKKKAIRDLTYYVNAHQNKINRRLHYFAFLFAFLGWIFLLFNLWITVVLAILHYVLSWVGHFYYEGNKPASFRYPWIGFYAGFLWFFIRTYELVTRRELLARIIRKE